MADQKPLPIAIVGMSCRLPGDVSDPGDFWRMLCRARSGWSKVPADRFNAAAYTHPNPDKKGTFNSQGGYFIKQDLSMFDAAFFDMTRKEAESMDPAQRLLLECSYEVLENAGIPKESISGKKIGVFVGANYTEHRVGNLRDLDTLPSFDATGNQGAFLAGRLAYYYNLRGPALTVDTACSSSMHAIHLAVQSIRSGEAEAALVGASELITQPDVWVSMAKLRLFSDSGRTNAFDHRAKSGFARGEGAGFVYLKPLAQAEADGDHIRAVITHTGISHNGRTVGIVAPSPEEQEQLIRHVLGQANIEPTEIAFFEAHGTGTKKGDPIEATAIHKAVATHFPPDEPLMLGSTKPNVGHLEGASGIISVIKSALMLYYGFILPNAEFEKANSEIPLARWKLQVPLLQTPFPSHRKYVCVNNFGFSGSNGHAVLSAAPVARTLELGDNKTYTALRLFVITANDEQALQASLDKLGVWLEQHAELYQTTMPRNMAHTLCQRRSHLPWRVAVVSGMCSGLARAITSHDVAPMRAPNTPPRLAFIFTGQGAQWHAMGRELLVSHPIFQEAIMRADASLRAIGADFSILDELLRDKAGTLVGKAHISQPICSAVQLALVDLLTSFNIRPAAVTGHSSGEIGAAYAAGALSFDSAMAAAYWRGQAIIQLKKNHPGLKGSMMAIGLGADEVTPILQDMFNQSEAGAGAAAVVACENSPSSTTLSGDESAIDRVASDFQQKGLFNRKLFVDVAYHSPHMRLVADSYLASICSIQTAANATTSPHVAFFSSLRGKRISLDELGPEYWVDNLTQPVRFSTSLQHLCKEDKPDILIEIGPHAALKGPIMQILKHVGPSAAKIAYLPTLIRDRDATETALELAGRLFMRGHQDLDFFNINHRRDELERPDMLPALFPYPWTRQKYWYEGRINRQHRLKQFARHDLLGTLADWSSDLEPTWRNIVCIQDLAWLREYLVQGRVVFPVSAFVSMAVEAASQRATMNGAGPTSRFEVHDLTVSEHLFVEDDAEIEMLLTLRSTENNSDGADHFRISSYEAKRGWLDHCRGTVRANTGPSSRRRAVVAPLELVKEVDVMEGPLSCDHTDTSSELATLNSKAPSSASSDGGLDADTLATSECPPVHGSEKMEADKTAPETASAGSIYQQLATRGVSYPRAFQTLVQFTANGKDASAHCSLPDTAVDMPHHHETSYRVHPCVLDAMLQLPLLSMPAHDPDAQLSVNLPSFIRQIHVSAAWRKRPYDAFCAHSTTDEKTGTFMIDAFSSPAAEVASITIMGLQFSPVRSETRVEVNEPRELCYKMRWEAARPVEAAAALDVGVPSRHRLTIVLANERSPEDSLVSTLSTRLEEYTGVRPQISSLDAMQEWGSYLIVLSELDRPMLSTIKESEFEQVQKMLTNAPGLLWVTRGAQRFSTMPNANMALGLVRTARSEREAVAATLDLDPSPEADATAQAALIIDAIRCSILSGSPDAEMEFAEEHGQLLVPRIMVDDRLNTAVHRELGLSAPYLQDFHQPDRQLRLATHAVQSIDRLYFEDSPRVQLRADEVEILVAASAITLDDLLPNREAAAKPIARSCSGTVIRLGKNVRDFSVGDRVCTLAEGAISTHVRTHMGSVSKIYSTVSLEQAASSPIFLGAAHFALADVAQVRSGDKVLLQVSGPVGLAAIEVARHLGAEPFVLVHNDAQAETVRKTGVEQDHVLDARSIYLHRQITQATARQGMDVILTTSGNQSSKIWECLADFGRFIEIRVSDSHQACRPELGANATFTSVNMGSLGVGRPQVVERTLKTLMVKLASGALRSSSDITTLPMSDLAKALRMVRDGAVQPVVVLAGVHEQVKAVHDKSTTSLRPNGTHIIVGGTGGLGRSMTKWLIEHGARNIVLLSRSGHADMARQLSHQLLCPDARIQVMKCDVGDKDSVRQVIKECNKSLPPICGLVHSAMVLRDGLLEKMTYPDYEAVIRPKVRGTWNLHNALHDTGAVLDYFVVLSSASGILGSRGQAAYAAANTFLDAFMAYRARNGLPGTALDLTAVTGAGYLADNEARASDILRNFGSETVNEAEVLALLSVAVRGDADTQVLTGLKLHMSPSGEWPYYARDARFTDLKAVATEEAHKLGLVTVKPVSPGVAFRAAKSEEEAAQVAGQGILGKLSEVLSISMDNLDAARNITSYGLDSLTAIELRNWIAKELRANLQILELLSSGTVNDLAALIVQKTKA